MTGGAHNAIPSNVVIKGDTRSLHPKISRFDYNDDILLTGAEYFAELVKQRMPK